MMMSTKNVTMIWSRGESRSDHELVDKTRIRITAKRRTETPRFNVAFCPCSDVRV
jgi:hypothetical protein